MVIEEARVLLQELRPWLHLRLIHPMQASRADWAGHVFPSTTQPQLILTFLLQECKLLRKLDQKEVETALVARRSHVQRMLKSQGSTCIFAKQAWKYQVHHLMTFHQPDLLVPNFEQSEHSDNQESYVYSSDFWRRRRQDSGLQVKQA
eukprot:TRINITY_DN24678_c0_g1_i1.p1 TRINITY_DN24678_c0_g1~~TRINITY_DN24678_c0_g1_i1.p1  ORF type:complete len:148 (-),score=7.44 TRINITY_DN24678_c0_g1_i1:32-475(-)